MLASFPGALVIGSRFTAVATTFRSASFFPIEAEQHQTFRTPLIATGFSADNASLRRLLTGSLATALSRKSCAPYSSTARKNEVARNCEMWVPPSNSNTKVKSGMTSHSICMTVEIRWDEKAGLRTGCGVRSQVIDVLEAQIKRRPALKKVSTATAKQSRNISQQKLTIGLDLGDRNTWYCVLDEAGQIQLEQRVRTSAKTLQEVFGEMREPC